MPLDNSPELNPVDGLLLLTRDVSIGGGNRLRFRDGRLLRSGLGGDLNRTFEPPAADLNLND